MNAVLLWITTVASVMAVVVAMAWTAPFCWLCKHPKSKHIDGPSWGKVVCTMCGRILGNRHVWRWWP